MSFPNFLQIRLELSGWVTRRRRTWLSILIQDFHRAGARSVAPLRHTKRVPLRLHIPAAPPVPADQPNPLAPRHEPANGKTAPRAPAARGGERRPPPARSPP